MSIVTIGLCSVQTREEEEATRLEDEWIMCGGSCGGRPTRTHACNEWVRVTPSLQIVHGTNIGVVFVVIGTAG